MPGEDLDMEPALPRTCPRRARSAILHALSVARIALLAATDRAAASVRREHELALLRQELRIKDARLERVPPHRRPHYPAVERLAILELRAARGWSAAQTAERFFVTEATVASWMARLDEDGPTALVRTPEPVNRFPDLVAHLVRRLKVLCPAMGTARIAAVLSRAGLHLGRTTVRRMLKRRPRRVAPAETVRSDRRIRSSRPNHIWLVDLTSVPTLAGFWISWLPWSVPQRWPFCSWVAVGVDHFSRRIMGVRAFRGRPTAKAMSAFLAGMIRAAGQAPRHLITDRGKQFTARSFRRGCCRAGIRQRFGAIGKHGSIALVERCIRTLKDEGVRRWLAPIRWRSVGRELSLVADWYNGHRPHAGLAGATPDEIYFGRLPAHHRPRFEPRARWPRSSRCARPQAPVRGRPGVRLALEVRYLEGRAHLPVVSLTRAA
jgi:transposase InsO family protein